MHGFEGEVEVAIPLSTLTDCKPYWSDLCAQISSKLLLPVETDCVDSDLSYSSSWSDKTVEKSWFSQALYTVLKPNSQPIFLPSFTATVAGCTPGEATARKSRKIRIFPSPEQKALLKKWFGVSRFVFNATIKYLQEPGTKANWMAIKTEILNSLPDWASSVPFQIKSIAIKDACQAVKKAKADFKKDWQVRRSKFRRRKDTKQSVFIPKTAIKDCGIYHTILGRSKLKEALTEAFSDGRLTLAYGEYYLIVSEEVQPRQTDNQGRAVALDPGVRTFMTFISEKSYGYLGNDSNLQIQKLCFKLDKLISKMSKAPSAQKKRFKKAADRLKAKIQDMVKELHHKTAKFLVDNFDLIFLPSFESSQMVSKSRRKLRSKTVRQMLTLSHYQFKKHLEWKAWESGKVALTNINEAYTSKTVSWTGEIKKIGGSRVIKDKDGRCMNRDINGARGIFLRALVDTPWLRERLNLCVC
ncbi:transposase [Microcoleus sp. A006_D1]|uniref:RNA-guided endonuclease InsQ/TnpB family protein n=1 Tax=Microcoleus sp. A006_D1 TaxID=3055267 RepID=UPI002FD1F4C1